MNEGNIDNSDAAGAEAAWFLTEADGFLGAPDRRGRGNGPLVSRIAERMRRRIRPEQLISNSLFGLLRYATLGAAYLGLAYAAKVLLGITISFDQAMH